MAKGLWRAKSFCLLVFDSTHHAMAAEEALEEAGLEILIVPTPHEISVSCGLAIRFHGSSQADVIDELNARSIVWNAIYECVQGNLHLRIRKEANHA